MDKAITLKLLFSIIVLLMYPKIESHWMPRGHLPRGPSPRPRPLKPIPIPIPTDPSTPLCKNQFILANRACALVPYTTTQSLTHEGSRQRHHSHDHGHNDHHHHEHHDKDHDNHDRDHGHDYNQHNHGHGHNYNHSHNYNHHDHNQDHHGHDHGRNNDHHDHGHGHNYDHRDNDHHRRHRHHHHHEGHDVTHSEEECCRWLKEIDNVCVCDVLARLPIFLSRPVHNYTIVVNDACDITFECASRMKI